jgi:hypothetical protein
MNATTQTATATAAIIARARRTLETVTSETEVVVPSAKTDTCPIVRNGPGRVGLAGLGLKGHTADQAREVRGASLADAPKGALLLTSCRRELSRVRAVLSGQGRRPLRPKLMAPRRGFQRECSRLGEADDRSLVHKSSHFATVFVAGRSSQR